MTDRDALHSLLIYAQREAAAQDLEVVSQLLTLTIANLAPASRAAADTGFDGAGGGDSSRDIAHGMLLVVRGWERHGSHGASSQGQRGGRRNEAHWVEVIKVVMFDATMAAIWEQLLSNGSD